MLNKTYSLRPHCVSCWTTCLLQDDTRNLQCQDKIRLSGFYVYPGGSPSQLIRLSVVLLYFNIENEKKLVEKCKENQKSHREF